MSNEFERKRLEERRLAREAAQKEASQSESAPKQATPVVSEPSESAVSTQEPQAPDKSVPVQETVLKKAPSSVKRPRGQVTYDVVQLPLFPQDLARAVRSEVPKASNNSDAIAAFVYAKLATKPSDTPLHIKQLADTMDGNEVIDDMNKRVSMIESHLSKFMSSMTEFEVALAYLIFDRLGWRNDSPARIGDVDLLEKGMTDMIEQLRRQSKEYRWQDNIRNGRDINYSKYKNDK